MAHITRYSFRGTSRLAADAGVSKSTISHLVRGKTGPLYSTVARVVKCLEIQLGRKLPFGQVISEDGSYPTRFVCRLVGCRGCLPEVMFDQDESRKVGFERAIAGQWTGDVDEFKKEEK